MSPDSQMNILLMGRSIPALNFTGGRALGRDTAALSTACENVLRGIGRTTSEWAVVGSTRTVRCSSSVNVRGRFIFGRRRQRIDVEHGNGAVPGVCLPRKFRS